MRNCFPAIIIKGTHYLMVASLDRGWAFPSSVTEQHLPPGWLHHIIPSFARWNRQMEMQVSIPCPGWFGCEPQRCWSPVPARSQASLQLCNKSSFNFVPVGGGLLYILSQSVEVSRAFISKIAKFQPNVTLHKLVWICFCSCIVAVNRPHPWDEFWYSWQSLNGKF